MTTEEIKDKVFNELKELKLTIADIEDFDYINYGWTFRFKEIKGWLFCLWIIKSDNEFKISFFGDRDEWIDKFKPGQCHIDRTYILKENSEFNVWPDLICYVEVQLRGLKRNKKVTEYIITKAYSYLSYISWLINDIWYYSIKEPIDIWFTKHILPIIAKSIAYYWQLKYHKYLKVKRVYHNAYYSLPELDVELEYKKDVEEYSIPYFGINNSKLAKLLDKHKVYIHHIEYGKTRGFYIKENYEKDL